jgi:hypothetical protein
MTTDATGATRAVSTTRAFKAAEVNFMFSVLGLVDCDRSRRFSIDRAVLHYRRSEVGDGRQIRDYNMFVDALSKECFFCTTCMSYYWMECAKPLL